MKKILTIALLLLCKSAISFSQNTLNANSIIRIGLYKPVEGITTSYVDETVAVFGNYSNAVNGDDSYKMENSADNIALLNSGNKLAIEARSAPSINDILPLGFSKLSNGTNYQLKIDASGYNTNGLDAYVKDAYKQTETIAISGKETTIDFTIDNAISASFNDRFYIIFKPSTLLSLDSSKHETNPTIKVHSIKIFPNPSNGNVNINISKSIGNNTIFVYDFIGKLIITIPFRDEIQRIITLDKGVYVLKVVNGEKAIFQNTIIVN